MNIAINKHSVEVNKIDLSLKKLAEKIRITNNFNRSILAGYVKALSGAKELFLKNELDEINSKKLKIGLTKVIKAADDDISMMR